MLRQKLHHQHIHLIAEHRLDMALGAQADRHRQDVTLRRRAKFLVELVQFQRGGDGVELCIAQNAAELCAVGAHSLGFFGGKFLHAISQLVRRGCVARFQRAWLLLAELVELLNRFLHQLQTLRPFCGCAGRLWISFRQNYLLVADGGEEMFGSGRVHQQMRPSED